ncbi:glycosyltransferase family 2 protein, partial [Candidatus Parcubacteria bacterium]|nr:glycosyltransferase family 2 protein [Candidatus Parcubacteria bacterium]
FMDADSSAPIHAIDKLISHMGDADIAIGSRYLPESNITVEPPFGRRLVSMCSIFITQNLLIPHLRDIRCGFKLFKREVAQAIADRQTIERFGFDTEMLVIAQKRNYKIAEVPIEWAYSRGSKLKFPRDLFRSLGEIARIKYNSLRGIYR